VTPSPAAAAAGAPPRAPASATAATHAVGPGTGRIHVIIRPPEQQ
jgi:hypothetical protein